MSRGRLLRPAAKAECSILFRTRADYQFVIGYYSNREKAGAWLDRPKGIIANQQRKAKELEKVSKKRGVP
jgi:hypothetical protein